MTEDGLVEKLVTLLEDNADLAFSFVEDVGSEIVDQATKGVAKLPAKIGKTAAKAIWNKIRSAIADRRFEKSWRSAQTRDEQELAVRKLLESSPKLACDLDELLQQRAYLIALREYCQQLPFLSAVFPGKSIRDVFVDLPIQFKTNSVAVPEVPSNLETSAFLQWFISQDRPDSDGGNYACFGGPGSGKSTLCRLLVEEHCERVLLHSDKANDATLLLPAYVRATDLIENDQPLTESLKAAIERELGQFLKAPLDKYFFQFRRKGRTRRWLIFVDGIDEIVDRERQLKLLRAINAARIDGSKTFKFFVSSRDEDIVHEVLGKDLHIVRLEELTARVVTSLVRNYSAALGRDLVSEPLLSAPLTQLQSALSTPLLIAITATVFNDSESRQPVLANLFDDFARTLLAKRGFSARASDDIRALLCDIAEMGESITIDSKVIAQSARRGVLEPALPTYFAKQAVLDLLLRSGLMMVSGNVVRFVHASFRQFFRAERFASQTVPTTSAWDSLDPYGNGWDFTRFVFEKWNTGSQDLSVVSKELLSYGTDGLRLFSKLAGQNSHLPDRLISAAIAKWRSLLEEDGPGLIDGAVDNLFIMGFNYDEAIGELCRIALDHWNYYEDAIEAAKYLVHHNRTDVSRKALVRIADTEYPPDQARAALALCEIGFRDLGINYLKQYVVDWAWREDEILGRICAIEALYRNGESEIALSALHALAKESLDGLDARFVAEAHADIINKEAAIEFLKSWLAKHPEIAHGEEILLRAKRDVKDRGLADLLESSRDYKKEKRANFQRLVSRVIALPATAQPLEIFRNRYVGVDMRLLALQQLSDGSDVVYRASVLEWIADPHVTFHDKEELILELRNRGCDVDIVEGLTQYMSRARKPDWRDAKGLTRAGMRVQGIACLRRISLNKAESFVERAEAIRTLADIGASELALDIFRSLWSTECTPSAFETMAKALLVTEHAAEVEKLLWGALRDKARLASMRLRASRLLFTPDLKGNAKLEIIRFLKSIAMEKTMSSIDRFEAIDQLGHLNREAACDLAYKIATDPKTEFEEGMLAAQLIERWAGGYMMVDAYENVVWDVKIAPLDRLEGLLYIHERLHPAPDDDGEMEELLSAARNELLRIAQDPSVSPDIRLRALALPYRSSPQVVSSNHSWPPEDAINSFLVDASTSWRIKQECVLRFCQCKPIAVNKYRRYLELETGDIAITLDCLELLENLGEHDLVLKRLTELACNTRVTLSNRLKSIRAVHRFGGGKLALKLIEQISRDSEGSIILPSASVADFASFLLDIRQESEALALCELALDVPLYNDGEARLEIIFFLARNGFSLQAKAALRKLIQMLPICTSFAVDCSYLHCAQVLENLGASEDARETLMTIARHTSMDLFLRMEACRILWQNGHNAEVEKVLAKLSKRKTLTANDRVNIAECYAALGLTQLAQKQLAIALEDESLSAYGWTRSRNLCVQVGLETELEELLTREAKTRSEEEIKADQLEVFLSLERWNDVKAHLLALKEAPSYDAITLIEAFGGLEKTPLKDFAIAELRTYVTGGTTPFERMRAAELLESMGDIDLARESFLALIQDNSLNSNERLWLVGDLISMNYDEIAYQQLNLVEKSDELTLDDRELLQDLRRNYLN